MREFWSMRSNKRQRCAQTLRFEPPTKRGIIQIPWGIDVRFADIGERSHNGLEG
jgi:hypothetical protein